ASLKNLTLAGLKDSVRLLVYLLATVLLGALLAPPLFWGAQSLAANGVFAILSRYDFETFFHRALLIAALILLWPLVRSLEIRKLEGLQLAPNPRYRRGWFWGALLLGLPPLLFGPRPLPAPAFFFPHATAITRPWGCAHAG